MSRSRWASSAERTTRLRTVTVHNLAEARAALNAARAQSEPVQLATPPDAVIQYGVLFFVKLVDILRAEFPELDPAIAVDCGDRADLAHAALNHGMKHIVFRGDPRLAEKLLDIAQGLGAKVEIVAADDVQKPN